MQRSRRAGTCTMTAATEPCSPGNWKGGTDMAVFRVEKTKDFTVMSNHHLRNVKLSLKAKGLLSLMLSLPEDWDFC